MCAQLLLFVNRKSRERRFVCPISQSGKEHTEKEGASGRTGCAKAGGSLRFYGSETVLRAVLSYMRLRIAAASLRLMVLAEWNVPFASEPVRMPAR